MQRMQQHGVQPTPRNYNLWFDYARQENKELVAELNQLIAHSNEVDDTTSDYLCRKYIETSTEYSDPQNARALLANILKVIGEVSSETQNYHNEIDGHIAELESQGDSSGVQEMLHAIVSSARGLKKSGEHLHQSLDESRAEIEVLRKNLQEVTNEAQRDFLTGLFNRKVFDRMMDDLTHYAFTEKKPLSLLMIDVDHFKHFNDEYGHLIGDEVLKMVARLLKDTVKGTDIVARFGGEEFAVILPHTPISGAQVVAENIRNGIASKELKHKESGTSFGSVTVSVGIAAYGMNDSVPTLIRRADEAMFAAKREGRNRVCCAEAAAVSS